MASPVRVTEPRYVQPRALLTPREGASDRHGLVLFHIVLVCAFIAVFRRPTIAGVPPRGWAWVAAWGVALAFMFDYRGQRVTFPVASWVPFFVYVLWRTEFGSRPEVQRCAMLMCPVAVGAAASRFSVSGFAAVRKGYWRLMVGIGVAHLSAVLVSGGLAMARQWCGIVGPPMTAVLVSIVALQCIHTNRRARWVLVLSWLYCLAVVARMPILVIPALCLVGPQRLPARVRLAFLVVLVLAGSLLYGTNVVQESLFRSGRGSATELMELDAHELMSGGRLYAWPQYWEQIEKKPWLGYGGVASLYYGRDELMYADHPHSEYIRLLFDYGIIGSLLFAIPLLHLMYICYMGRKVKTGPSWRLYEFGFWGIVAAMLLGITGNVIMYVAWFGNPLFVTIGLACGTAHRERAQLRKQRARPRV